MQLSNIDNIYNSYKSTIISAISLINTNPSFDGKSQQNNHCKRSLFPFLGDAIRWLPGTATTKDLNSIKTRVNQLLMTQSLQQEALVHIVSILNVTQYAVQVNRHSINILMDKVDEISHDINNLYNLTTSLATSISFHQLLLHISSVLANLCDSLNYIRMGCYTYHGQYQCSHIRNIISTQTTSNGSTENVDTHRRNTTINATPTSLIR